MTEVLAPAGDFECMQAAVRAGADAVYFGLPGFNARARATNILASELPEAVSFLHRHGVLGYVTLNTLVFDHERKAMEEAIVSCAQAGVDAVIVQDWAVAKLVSAMVPSMRIHASTQMTCTDAGGVEFAASLGVRRVVLARELSLSQIEVIARATDVELEVFVHGALCVAYSGQCLTSEAIGGRSANRGACAQSCRLPYELVVDGSIRELGDTAYLLSPEDLEASQMVPELVRIGVRSLKIEGRLKGPDYVTATTHLYRRAVDAAMENASVNLERERALALQLFSRGSGPGFLAGVDHQRLVEGRHCDHRGIKVGELDAVADHGGHAWLEFVTNVPLERGDGVLVEGGPAGVGEVGGHLWELLENGKRVSQIAKGGRVRAWLGPEKDVRLCKKGRAIFRTHGKGTERAVRELIADPRVPIDVHVYGREGEPLQFRAKSIRAHRAQVQTEVLLERARSNALSREMVLSKLDKMHETPFVVRELTWDVSDGVTLPFSAVNRARRALVAALEGSLLRAHGLVPSTLSPSMPKDRVRRSGLFALCRTLEQAQAAVEAGADGVYLDFLELTGTGVALRSLRTSGVSYIGVAPPRVRKPGEEKIDKYLYDLEPDAFLVRSLGTLQALSDEGRTFGGETIGDFSLNLVNRLSATEALLRGLSAFVPSFDLNSAQLLELLNGELGPYAEVVVHHPMPLFHMEHCVFAALLSNGSDHRTCGRPCDRHAVSLRDRAGYEHPVIADVGCRNTVFHGQAQSAADVIEPLRERKVERFRVELVRETAEETGRVIGAYRRLLDGSVTGRDAWRELRVMSGYGVVRGSLRVLS